MAVKTQTKAEAETKALALIDPASSDQGNVKQTGGSLRKLEQIVETNGQKGAILWRKAADALLEIRDRKLWKLAKDSAGEPYKNFATYAEARFGFKKTYAYDLVKAATRKPEAITEGAARAELKAERGVAPLTRDAAIEKMTRAWQRFEDSAGDTRDRAVEDEAFVKAYDKFQKKAGDLFHAFVTAFITIEGTATETTDDVQPD